MNGSSKLPLYFGLKVLPRLYFSPDGDLGGVSPFEVGDPGAFCIFVMKRGEGGAVRVWLGFSDLISVKSLLMS